MFFPSPSAVVSDGQDPIQKRSLGPFTESPTVRATFIICARRPNRYHGGRSSWERGTEKAGSAGVRPIERSWRRSPASRPGSSGATAVAVGAALTDDGLPPLSASGLKLHQRLNLIVTSLDRLFDKTGDVPEGLKTYDSCYCPRDWTRRPRCGRR